MVDRSAMTLRAPALLALGAWVAVGSAVAACGGPAGAVDGPLDAADGPGPTAREPAGPSPWLVDIDAYCATGECCPAPGPRGRGVSVLPAARPPVERRMSHR